MAGDLEVHNSFVACRPRPAPDEPPRAAVADQASVTDSAACLRRRNFWIFPVAVVGS